MKYETPTIDVLGHTLQVVQGSSSKGRMAVDNADHQATTAAYEADE